MKRVLLVGPAGHGGEEVYVRSLVAHAPVGHRYELSADFHRGTPAGRAMRWQEIALNRLVHPRLIPDIGFRALRVVGDVDVVHLHAHPTRLTFARGRTATVVMSEGSSSAVYLRDYLGWDEDRLRRAYDRTRTVYRLLGVRDRLLATGEVQGVYVFSAWAREVNLRWGADPAKLDVVPPGFPTPDTVAAPGSRDTFTFVFVGTDFERKGGFDVVAAFDRVARDVPDVHLRLVSPHPSVRNPDRHVHTWLTDAERQRGIETFQRLLASSRATWDGPSTRQALYEDVYPEADCFVMPSRAEGFGFTNVEAMSFGLPVITSTAGPTAEYVADGATGLRVAPGDVAALADAMATLAGDRAGAAAMGSKARDTFLDRFTLDHQQRAIAAFYERCAQR